VSALCHRANVSLLALLCATSSPIQAETIAPVFKHELPGAAGKSFTVVEVDFPARNKADPHRHGQAFVYAYVLSGAVRSQLAGEPAQTYLAGESWFEPPGAHHVLTENLSRTKPARLLVIFVANAGEPLKTADHPEGSPIMLQQSTRPAQTSAQLAGPAADTPPPTPQKMVDALYSAFGDNHSRAVHAKGIMATGTFQPDLGGARLSKAAIFARGSLPILVRFSNFTGIPTIPDTIGDANPRGLAIKFQMADGSSADVIAHSFNGFPTATTEEFRQLLLAIGSSGADATKPTALDAFLTTHPIAKTFLTTQKPFPKSYATLSYFGVNSFRFTESNEHEFFVRYRFVPVDGEGFLSKEALTAAGPNYLQTELPARLAKMPIAFTWYAQIAEAADVIGDPSIAWPESRQLVKLGTVRIDRIVPDPVTTDKGTLFLPLNVPAGIEPADPMLSIRQGAYPLSFKHRQ
jgi:catalase